MNVMGFSHYISLRYMKSFFWVYLDALWNTMHVAAGGHYGESTMSRYMITLLSSYGVTMDIFACLWNVIVLHCNCVCPKSYRIE